MTDQTKRVSEFSIAPSLQDTDRLLVLTDPQSVPEVKTVTFGTVINSFASVGEYVSNSQLQANLRNYQTTAGLAGAVAVLDCNNATYFGGVSAVDFVTSSQLSANVAMLISKLQFEGNLANYPTKTEFTDNLVRYQTSAGLAANVAKLSANNAAYLNGLSAFDYVTVTGLNNNLANYPTSTQLTANLARYQTTAGLSSNVGRLTSNSANFIGTLSSVNVVSNAQLQGNLNSYQTLTGLSSNVARLSANNATYFDGNPVVNFPNTTQLTANLARYQTTAGLSSNVLTLTSNNSLHLGGYSAASYLKEADLDYYLRVEDLESSVRLLTSNASFYSNVATYVSGNGSVNAYSGNFTANVSANNFLMDAGFGSKAPMYGVRAWGTFDGRVGTVGWWWWWWFYAITELEEGVYRLTFNTPMPDTNYAVLGNADLDRVNVWFWFLYPGPANVDVVERTTTYVTVRVVGGWWYNALIKYASPKISVAVIR
jgi:hypothetical protein